MTRMLQRGIVIFAALALLAAACGDDTTADRDAADKTAPSTTIEETTPPTPIEESVPPDPVEEEMSAEDRFDYGCLPRNDPLPFPGTVTAVAGGSYGYDMWLMAVAIEEAPDPILMFFNEPHGLWAALDRASAEYTGFAELDGLGKEVMGLGNPDLPAEAMQAVMARCLASIEN